MGPAPSLLLCTTLSILSEFKAVGTCFKEVLVLQGGSSLLQKAKGMVSQMEDRYMLYMLEQDRMARMSEDQNAETSMDMVRLQRRLLVLC